MRIIVLILILFSALPITAQSFSYAYDVSGNRIHREMVELKSMTNYSDTSTEAVVSKLEEMQISIFPNPTQGVLRIEITNLPEGSDGSLTIWNLGGQEVLHLFSISSSMLADMSGLPTGNYLMQLKVGTENKEWTVVKQ